MNASPPNILFADKRFLVIDKPAGLAVHPGRAGGPSIEDYFPSWRVGRHGPWLVHRLDQDTEGCLVIALKKPALLAAQSLFAAGGASKIYWAAVQGVPKEGRGLIDQKLAKITKDRRWRMTVDTSGADAITEFSVLGHNERMAWVEFRPKTGRTHQIRAHSAWLGHPIIGDAVYGGGAGKMQLLARAITLELTPPVSAVAPVPAHMLAALRACGYER